MKLISILILTLFAINSHVTMAKTCKAYSNSIDPSKERLFTTTRWELWKEKLFTKKNYEYTSPSEAHYVITIRSYVESGYWTIEETSTGKIRFSEEIKTNPFSLLFYKMDNSRIIRNKNIYKALPHCDDLDDLFRD